VGKAILPGNSKFSLSKRHYQTQVSITKFYSNISKPLAIMPDIGV